MNYVMFLCSGRTIASGAGPAPVIDPLLGTDNGLGLDFVADTYILRY